MLDPTCWNRLHVMLDEVESTKDVGSNSLNLVNIDQNRLTFEHGSWIKSIVTITNML